MSSGLRGGYPFIPHASTALSSEVVRNRRRRNNPNTRMLALVQLSLALILPGAPLTRLSGGSRVPGIVAQETRDAEKEYASSCYLPTDTRAPRRTPCPYCVTREAPSRTAFSLPARALAAPTCSPLLAGMPARATCRPTGRLVRHTGPEPRTSRAQAGHLATHASVPRLGQSRSSRSGSTTMTRRCTTSSCYKT